MKVVDFAQLYIAFSKLYLIQGLGLIPPDLDQHNPKPGSWVWYDIEKQAEKKYYQGSESSL